MTRAAAFLRPGELVVDCFAGGGGASTGIEQGLGRPIDIAINHSPHAIAVHRANHPATRHYLSNVWEVDPVEACAGRPVGLAWFSPDCTFFSRARGGKPRSRKARCLAWTVTRWAKAVRPRVILVENVQEFEDWGPLDDHDQPIKSQAGRTFRAWVAKLRAYGYAVEWRVLVAADYGTPTTRRRLFIIARRDGRPIAWPAPTHGAGRPRPWRAASEVVDWSRACPSIFERRRALAPATLRRIAAGVRRYVLDAARPFIVPVTHPRDARVHSIDAPLRTVTAAHRGEMALVTPFVAPLNGEDGHARPRTRSVELPLHTVMASSAKHMLVAPALVQTGYGERQGQPPRTLDLGRPLGTVVAGGQKHALVAAFLAKHYGGVVGHGVERPLGTVTGVDHHAVTLAFLAKFYGTSSAADVATPMPTVTAGGNHLAEVRALLARDAGGGDAVVEIAGARYAIVDIGMRMLEPHELFGAQGFPAGYVIAPVHEGRPLTKTAQIQLAGNSVPPQLSRALVEANLGRRATSAA